VVRRENTTIGQGEAVKGIIPEVEVTVEIEVIRQGRELGYGTVG